MKRILITLTVAVLLIFGSSVAFAAEDTAKLYNYYGDNMLFKQNDEVVLGGTADSGTKIACTLTDSKGKQVAFAETVSQGGTFSLSFAAPNGSFEEYTITLTANGTVFDELKDVVFGELWLAGGQSNMEWPLWGSKTGAQMQKQNKTGSSALRFLDVPHPGNYHGAAHLAPPYPQNDYENPVLWYKGSDSMVYNMSAVGYFFAENLIEELGVPVGIINANLGGTAIYSWLPRTAIENDPALLADCKSENRYVPEDSWDETKVNHIIDMSVNYNKTIAPLKNLRLSGMIWYQGEADVNFSYGKYTRAFNALQQSYSECFSYDGELPVVFTQLASYRYETLTLLQNTNVEFSHIQQQKPASRALVSILDVPAEYQATTHAIHPICKKEVGDKMAYAAKGLVYGLHDSYTAPTVERTEIKNGCVYVTLRDVGDKLIAEGDVLHGFAVCGGDGVYFSAKAEIISDNTIKVYSPSVVAPKSVSYAYTPSNMHANLFSSRNGEKLLAVSPFVTDFSFDKHHWHNDYWATCDFSEFWHCHLNEYSGFYSTWNADNANVSFVESTIDTGNALSVTSNGSEQFSISPNMTFNENGTVIHFQDIDLDWSDYQTLTFKIKVNSGDALSFEGLKIGITEKLWVMAGVKDIKATGCEIATDGKIYTVTLDLGRLYPYGNVFAGSYGSDILGKIQSAEFIFEDGSQSGVDFTFDDVSFKSERPAQDEIKKVAVKNEFIERIKGFFMSLKAKIYLLFDKLF